MLGVGAWSRYVYSGAWQVWKFRRRRPFHRCRGGIRAGEEVNVIEINRVHMYEKRHTYLDVRVSTASCALVRANARGRIASIVRNRYIEFAAATIAL